MSAAPESPTRPAGLDAPERPRPAGALRAAGGPSTTIAHAVIRVTGPVQVGLGLLFWAGLALALLPLHMVLGLAFVVALWTLAALAALHGLRPVLVLLAVGWGLILPAFGVVQTRLLPGPLHWTIRTLHLLIGVVAMVMAARLVRFIRQTDRRPDHVPDR